MRALVACSACRARRRKCETQDGSTSCTYCIRRGFTCSQGMQTPNANGRREHSTISSPGSSENRGSGLDLPDQELCLELVELYFDLIHDQFHSLFHKPSFMEDVRQGVAPRVILFAMMALSARFSKNEAFANVAPRDRTKLYYDESASLLNIRDASLTTIQACVLLGAVSTTEDNAIIESVFYTVACRMANLLDLAHRPANALEREINIRVWWTLCMIDVWSSASVRQMRMMNHLEDLPLPLDEVTFLNWRRGTDIIPVLTADPKSSLLAQMITLNRILLEINEVIAQAAASPTANLVVEHTVQELSQKLNDWYNALPEYMQDTPENLKRYASQGLGRIFVAVYLGYYHYGQLLFYQYLHEDRNSGGGNYYANKCKGFAANLCRMVYAAHATPGCEVWYNMVGHILVIASTIQIHTLLFSTHEHEIAAARARLEKNFETLTQLRSYWPMLDMCFARLQIFHETCRKREEESFRMDQWMLKFLSEFRSPIEAKKDDEEVHYLSTVHNVGVSPQDWV